MTGKRSEVVSYIKCRDCLSWFLRRNQIFAIRKGKKEKEPFLPDAAVDYLVCLTYLNWSKIGRFEVVEFLSEAIKNRFNTSRWTNTQRVF